MIENAAADIIPQGWSQKDYDYAMTTLIPCLVDLKRKARERMAAKQVESKKN